jgi:hypothetical protein
MRLRFLPALLFASFIAPTFAGPPQASPAFVDSVTFKILAEGDTRVFTVTTGPTLVRIDAPNDRMSVLYDPQTEHYIGLEHSNYTYWDFTWPEVRDAVQGSQRYAARLRDIGPSMLTEDGATPAVPASTAAPAPSGDTNAAASTSDPAGTPSAGNDNTGYVWHPADGKKRIADFDCVHWVGETLSGENMDVWCTAGLVTPVEKAVATLRAINEPMALVPVRNFVPPDVFIAWDAMTKAGLTPVLITWGQGDEAGRFALVSDKTREGKLSLFQIPRLYVKTTLVTMDGIGNQRPSSGPHNYEPPKHERPPGNGPTIDGGLP